MAAADDAASLFDSGRNCAQSVVGAFAGRLGMDPEVAMRLAGGLGGGLRVGEVCGAAAGAALVAGARYGDDKELCNRKTREFMDRFQRRFGHFACRDLLRDAGRRRCRELVMAVAEELELLG